MITVAINRKVFVLSLPKISERGFIISEVKGHTTKTGKIMATFTTAHSKSRKDEQTGEWERVSQMLVDWVAFDALAEFILENVHPKTEVDVVGEVYLDEWTNPETGDVRKSVKGTLKACSPSVEKFEKSGGSQGGSGSVW